jgi:hypothetical protein
MTLLSYDELERLAYEHEHGKAAFQATSAA